MLDRLVVPLQLAGLDVERDDRTEIQVGARAFVARVLRHAVAGAEVDEAEVGVRGADEPDGAAADLICIRRRPRLVADVFRSGDDEEFPGFLSGVAVKRHDLAAEAGIGRRADEHQSARVERRARNPLAGTRRVDTGVAVPEFLAGLLVERDRVRVRETDEHFAVGDGDAFAIGESGFGPREVVQAAVVSGCGRARLVLPDGRAGLRVDRIHVAAAGEEQHAVLDDRHRASGAAVHEALGQPRALQFRQRVAADLRQRRVARVAEVAADRRPFLR